MFFDVPSPPVSRVWGGISIAYSNRFRVRGLSKDNGFRIAIGLGYTDGDSVPVIVSQSYLFVQSDVWQELHIPISDVYSGDSLFVFARISDTKWGDRGPVNYLLKEGSRMIYDAPDAATLYASRRVTGEVHSYHGPAALLAAGTRVEIPANPKRKAGFVYQNYTNPVFVYFSDPVPAGNVDKNTARVAKGGRIEIPEDYTGKIFVDVKGQFSPDPGLLCCVQYEGDAVV